MGAFLMILREEKLIRNAQPISAKTFQLDAIEMMKQLKSGVVDLIITDPPYESLEKHRKIGTTTRLSKSKSSSNEWFGIFPNSRFPSFFEQAYRVLSKNSHLYVMCDEETLFAIKPMAEAAGFKFWKSIIWDKQAIGMGYHYRNKTERIAFFEKGKRKLNNLSISDLISVKRVYRGYPTEKPVGLFDVLVEQSSQPGELILDPFFGSGASLISGIKSGRSVIGNDVSPSAHEHFYKRLDEFIELDEVAL